MPTKTYNMGRVVGWSTYEEFLKENPNIDPSKVTSMVYSTMVTYGVTRIVTLPATANRWQPVQGTDTVFYTATVEVPGATYGAVPIVGINYDYYIRTFKGSAKKYSDATELAGTNKELLEKAFSCIFTCYVSDANGVKVENAVMNSGYLTFAAYPDIVDYLANVAALVAPESGLKVIVRGLSLSGFTDAEDLYFGPEGLVIATGGVAAESKYCEQDTLDISALCLNASGYIWMNTGGGSPNGSEAVFTSLTGHPHGEVLISTFGYLNPEMIDGTGSFENLGTYAFTYEQCEDVRHTPNFSMLDTQIRALEAVSSDEPKKYVYLIAGRPSYDAPPTGGNPMFIIPVRKSDYYVNVGDFDALTVPKLKKKFDMTRCLGTDDKKVIVPSTKQTKNYLGSYWDANYQGTVPTECKVAYFGNSSFGSARWIDTNIHDLTNQYWDNGRTANFKISNNIFPEKGDFIVLFNQPHYDCNGLYQCVMDESEATDGYRTFIRRGSYLSMNIPSYATHAYWQLELPSSAHVVVVDGVLTINGTRIYPGELLVLGTSSNHKQYFVVNTITGENTPQVILANDIYFPMDLTNQSTVAIWGDSDDYTDYISVSEWDLQHYLAAKTIDVWTSDPNPISFTLTLDAFTPGLLFNVKHDTEGYYGYDKWYRYVYLGVTGAMCKFASAELWTSNSNLSRVAGHPGRFNSAFPSYNQTVPTEDGSWHYNAPAALSHIPAKKMFQDFGLDIADYVHEDFQNVSLGKFLQECVLRTDLTMAATDSTMRTTGIESTLHLYSKEDMNYTSGNVPTPTASSPISASMTLHAGTSAKSYFSTAYYNATLRDGTSVTINNSAYPIWASMSKSPEGTEIMSVSVTDNSGSQLDFSGNSGTIEADTVTWLDLLVGLGSGKSVDVLKGARFGRDNNDCNYIQTADGTRLYISTTEPTGDIPEGSIGIGW